MIGWLRLRRMRRAFRALPERDRAIFGSVRLDELDYVQAAELRLQRRGCGADDCARVDRARSR